MSESNSDSPIQCPSGREYPDKRLESIEAQLASAHRIIEALYAVIRAEKEKAMLLDELEGKAKCTSDAIDGRSGGSGSPAMEMKIEEHYK